MLLLWAPVAAMAFTQMKTTRAAMVTIVGGIIFLPERAAFDLPLVPPFDKNALSVLYALVLIFVTAPARFRRAKLLRGVDLWFLFFVVGAFGTTMTNGDSFVYGGGLHWNGVDRFPVTVLPAMTTRDIPSTIIRDVVDLYFPYLAGRLIIQDRKDVEEFFRMMTFFGVIYVPLMFFEAVMSPQLHRWFYGYHPASFIHAVRGTGYKPYVFLRGGLAVASYMYLTMMCAAVCVRLKIKLPMGIPAGGALIGIVIAIAISRNVGVLVYVAATLPLALFLGASSQTRIAVFLAVVFASFPYSRTSKIFPTEKILDVAKGYSMHRWQSLKTRFDNEDALLARALERPAWGWGTFGRNRIYDKRTGYDTSITDGEWIIQLGVRGIVGAIAFFAICMWPILSAWRSMRKIASKHGKLIVAMFALCIGTLIVDLLPNSAFNKLVYFAAGALVGIVRALKAERAGTPVMAPPRGVRAAVMPPGLPPR